MDLFLDLLEWIETNDRYAWDAEYYSYLVDSMEYAKRIQKSYGVEITEFLDSFIVPIILRTKNKIIEDFVEILLSIDEDPDGELSEHGTEHLEKLISAYRKISPIADKIKSEVYKTNNKKLIERFEKLIDGSNYLKKIYRGGNMITTVEEFVKFIKENSGKLVGVKVWGDAFVTFKHPLLKEEKTLLKQIAKDYGLSENSLDLEIENDCVISFLVDRLVGKENDVNRLIEFIASINEISEIKEISISFSFNFE